MSLKTRREYFDKLSKKIKCKKINDLMLEVDIPKPLFYNLSHYTKIYLSKCLGTNNIFINENILINHLKSKKNKLFNVTPNGMIVPKNEMGIEFNLLIKSYAEIINNLNIENIIDNFHFPPNIRIKFSQADKSNLKRNHPTEYMHADTWTGANPNWVACHIFLVGDTRNQIRYAYPRNNFEEDWLKPLKKASDGIQIAKNYDLIEYHPKKSKLILADATIIHQSFRKKNAGIRVSLDTGFDMRMPKLKSFKKIVIGNENVSKIRKYETFSKERFLSIGKHTYFHFPDKIKNNKKVKGLFKHSANYNMIKLDK